MQLRRLVPQGHAARANDSAEKRAKLSAALATDHERENSMKAITHQNDAWEAWRPGVESRMLVSAGNGAVQLCMFEQWIAPGVGAPTHSHPVEEVLTVREGEAEMWIEQARMTMVAGQSLIVPAGRLHGFRNSGTSKLHIHAVLASPVFEATPEGAAEVTRRWD
jgi:quercetin dioxygenase-like cupin family protein